MKTSRLFGVKGTTELSDDLSEIIDIRIERAKGWR
jgi:hypothetical protein